MPLVKQRWQDAFPVAKAGSRNNAQGAGSSLGKFGILTYTTSIDVSITC